VDTGWVAIVVLGALLFLWGYGDSVAASNKIVEGIREKLHKERLAALEKGLPPPDGSFDEALLAYFAEGGGDALDQRGRRRQARAWAITLILAGIGWAGATLLVPDTSQLRELRDAFGFGLIPLLLGVGVLLHSHWSRD
jgi:hypothetical protein